MLIFFLKLAKQNMFSFVVELHPFNSPGKENTMNVTVKVKSSKCSWNQSPSQTCFRSLSPPPWKSQQWQTHTDWHVSSADHTLFFFFYIPCKAVLVCHMSAMIWRQHPPKKCQLEKRIVSASANATFMWMAALCCGMSCDTEMPSVTWYE